MDKQDDGGPAFPTLEKVGQLAMTSGGLTIRDWFAGQALANAADMWMPNTSAERAYALADAMLAARKVSR